MILNSKDNMGTFNLHYIFERFYKRLNENGRNNSMKKAYHFKRWKRINVSRNTF